MTTPLRQFLIISIVGVTLTLASLLYLHIELSQQYLDQHLDSHNKNLAIVLRNSLLESDLEREMTSGSRALPDSTLLNIRKHLERELRWVPVIKVKIYSAEGIVLFSSKADEIGDKAHHNQGFQGALAGNPVSGQVHSNHMNEFDNVIEIEDLHQQYVPIESRRSGEIIGVFETYLNIHDIVSDVESRQRKMFWLMGAVLAAIYLALSITFLRTHRMLRIETGQRQAQMSELESMHAELEQRVQKRTAELDQARIFLQSVIDGIANPLFVIRPDFTIALMNEKAREQIPQGAQAGEYRYCYQVSHGLDQPCCKPHHPCSFREVMEKGRAVTMRHTHHDADNNPIVLDMLTTPLYSADGEFEGVIEVQHDVTQLVEIQNGLMQSEARLQAIMDNVPDAILTCDSDCVIISSNKSAQALFDIPESGLIGRRLSEFSVEGDIVELKAGAISLQQQTVLKQDSGKEFPADLWIGPLSRGNGDSSYIVVVRDVTGRVKAQRELETTRQQYFHQEKMAAIGQLAAGILHEVGNPIAAIAGAAAEVKHANEVHMEGDYINNNIELINQQITRLGKITREIADFASPKPRERELLDLNGLLQGTARLLTYDRRFSSIGVTLKLDRNLPAIVGVADQLTQVFMNLLINAMDACSALESEQDSIILSSELDGDRVHVCVQDFGIGMSAETLEHVMETFYTTKPVGEGSGLGLSLCDTIVTAHGGEMRIESEEAVGTRVHVFLPIDLVVETSGEGDAADNRKAI